MALIRSTEMKKSSTARSYVKMATMIALLTWAPSASGQARGESLMWAASLRGAHSAAKGDFKRAASAFRSALQWVESPEIRGALALCRLARGDRRGASSLLAKLARSRTTAHEIHYWMARIDLAAKRYGAACNNANNALSLGGDRPELLLLKSAACKLAGKSSSAGRALARAAEKTGDLLDSRFYPGVVGGVLDLVARSLTTFPDKQRAWVTMAHIYYTARHYSKAEHLADRVRKRWGHVHEALFIKARCRLAAGDVNGALSWANRTLGSRSSDPAALALRAEIRMMQNEPAKALADLEKSLRGDPRDGYNLSRLGKLLWEKGHYARAEKMFRYALVRLPRLASAHHGLALALARLKKHDQAEKHYKLAISSSPARPSYRKAYAVFLQARDRDDEANKQLRIAKSLDRYRKRFSKKATKIEALRRSQLQAVRLASRSKLEAASKKARKISKPSSARWFLQSHIRSARKEKNLSSARRALGGITAPSIWSLDRKVTRIEVRGKALGTVRFVFQKHLAYANPLRFR